MTAAGPRVVAHGAGGADLAGVGGAGVGGDAGTPEPPWLTTPRLVLRRPRRSDLADYVRLHTDPRTYAHVPAAMPDAARCVERLDADLAAWAADGVGYAAVLDRATASVIGWAGLRREQVDDRALLNLYYRLAHEHLGRGYGKEIARALTAWALEWRPELAVSALVDPSNVASLATAEAAGLVRVGERAPTRERPSPTPMIELLAPTVSVVAPGHDAGGTADVLADELVELWMRVNESGGAVGFVPGTPRADVESTLAGALAEVRDGRACLAELRDPRGGLLGIGFWLVPDQNRREHVAWLSRLMVDPERQGHNLGRLLLAAMVGVARRELNGIRQLRLEYRSGLGLGRFYEANGWVEVGRVAQGLWLGGEEFRDDVLMARRVDGGPLLPDGQH